MSTMPLRKSLPMNNYSKKKKFYKLQMDNLPSTKVVRLIGNMEENINQVLRNIECHCGADQQFYEVAHVYCNKIEKLRKQRDDYKVKWQEMKNKVKQYEEKEEYMKKYWTFNNIQPIQENKSKSKDSFDISEQNLLLSPRSSFNHEKSPYFKAQAPNIDYPDLKQYFMQPNCEINYEKKASKQNPEIENYFLRQKLGIKQQNLNQYFNIVQKSQTRNIMKPPLYHMSKENSLKKTQQIDHIKRGQKKRDQNQIGFKKSQKSR